MSEEIKVVKRRGRPKKVVEADTIILIDSSTDTITGARPTRTRKSSIKTTVDKSLEQDSVLVKNASRKVVVKAVVDPGKPKVTRTRKTAKSMENVEAVMTASSTSSILRPATAFTDSKSSKTSVSKPKALSSVNKALSTISKRPAKATTTTELNIPENNLQAISQLQSRVNILTNTIRDHTQQYLELALSRSSSHLQHHSNTTAQLVRPHHFHTQTTAVSRQLDSLSKTITTSATVTQGLQRARRASRITQLTAESNRLDHKTRQIQLDRPHHFHTQTTAVSRQLDSLSKTITTSATVTQGLQRARRASRITQLTAESNRLDHKTRQIQLDTLRVERDRLGRDWTSNYKLAVHHLDSRVTDLTTAVQTSAACLKQLAAATGPPHSSSPTIEPTGRTAMQPQSSTATSSLSTLTTQFQTQARRNLTSKTPHPSSITPTPEPHRPRPTELPYEVLRKDPRFKSQSRKWTGIIVGIPVFVMSSWVLYKRYQDTLFKREVASDRKRGELPGLGDGGEQSIGVGRRSDVGHNGGV